MQLQLIIYYPEKMKGIVINDYLNFIWVKAYISLLEKVIFLSFWFSYYIYC